MYSKFRKPVRNVIFLGVYCVVLGLYRVLRGGRSITWVFRGLEEESCGPKSPLMLMELDSYGTSKWDLWVLRVNVEYYCL